MNGEPLPATPASHTAPAPLLTVAQALERLLAAAQDQPAVESLPLEQALGRVLAADLVSSIDVPPWDSSAMDGYALRAADYALASGHGPGEASDGGLDEGLRGGANGRLLPVTQRIPAGATPGALEPGAAARIFTGAAVPAGADTIVPQELAQAADGRVRFTELPAPGEWINRRGADIAAGATLLTAGIRLNAAALGLAASVGMPRVSVARRPRVAMLFTGNELTRPGEPLRPGGIYNSNRYTLGALLANAGCEVDDCGIVADNLEATRAALENAALDHDLVLSCGGVSVGEEDHVRPAVEACGRLDLWRIAVKPGKPLAFGAIRRGGALADLPASGPAAGDASAGRRGATLASRAAACHFIGLPGNPVSSFVTFLLFVRPFLLRLQGVRDLAPQAVWVRADFEQRKSDARHEFLRARLNADGGLDLFPNQSSAVLTSAVWADGLIDNPPGHRIVRGEQVRFLPFGGF